MNIGVWIDKERAIVVQEENGQTTMNTIHSEIDTRRRDDGEGNPVGRFGEQYIEPEQNKENREAEQSKSFFQTITDAISNADKLVIFGPAQMKTEFKKHLDGLSGFKPAITGVESADSMTDNQVAAWVRDYFAS